MNTFIVKTKIECGETTCASKPGVFCSQLGARAFGQRPWCLFFDEQLHDKDGWIQRCGTCLLVEKESK